MWQLSQTRELNHSPFSCCLWRPAVKRCGKVATCWFHGKVQLRDETPKHQWHNSINPNSVQFRHVLSIYLRPHELQHARLPCPSPTPGAYSNSCPSSQWCHPTILTSHPLLLLPSILPSIRVFSDKSVLRIRWPKCRSFSFSISPSNEHPGLISFRMGWLDLLAVQGILKRLVVA